MTLLEEFNNMKCIPIFEINLWELGINSPDEYEIFEIRANLKGLRVAYSDLEIKWDECFSLDEHLECLYNQIIEYLLQYHTKNKIEVGE